MQVGRIDYWINAPVLITHMINTMITVSQMSDDAPTPPKKRPVNKDEDEDTVAFPTCRMGSSTPLTNRVTVPLPDIT